MRHLTVPSRVVFGILLVFLVSCGTGHDSDEKYFLISTNVKIPYWQAGAAGLFVPRNANAATEVSSDITMP